MKNTLPGVLVKVYGQVMLNKVEPGRYRILLTKGKGSMSVFWFFRPSGTKPLFGHYADDVAAWVRPANSRVPNRIVAISA